METIAAFRTRDGRQFYDRARAEEHERELDEVAQLPIAPKHDWTTKQANGAGYWQHPKGTKERLYRALVASEYKHPRQADDSGSPYWPLGWARWMAIDALDREWGQPYFASHPNPSAVRINREEER